MFSCFSGLELTHRTAVREVPSSVLGSAKLFIACFLLLRIYFFAQNILFVKDVALRFAVLLHLVDLTFVTDYKCF